MRHRRNLALLLQVLLVVVASLLGIVTNYATNAEDAPAWLNVLQQVAAPGIGVLIVVLVVGHVVAYRLESPPPPRRSWDSARSPYPGLDAYTEDEAAVFFGREAQIADLVRRLSTPTSRPADRFVALVGSSGSGKSSLVQAGVVPRLRARRWVILPTMTPGTNPFGALARVLAQAGGGPDDAAISRRLRKSPDMLSTLLNEIRSKSGQRFRRTLLVVDQFEELVTLAGERDRALFLDTLARAVAQDPRLSVIGTIRIEFLRDLLETAHAELFQNPLAIGAVGRAQMLQIIQRPGELVEMTFAPGLAETIVDEVGSSDALPLLAYLLQEAYFAVGPGAEVTQERYRALGGVAGALSRQADQVLAELREEEEPGAIFSVLLKFVTVEGQEAARRRVPLAELTERERRVVDAFVDARLLVTGAEDGRPYAQVAHEALFRQWPPLRQEVETRIEQLRRRAELERWAADWQQSGRSEDYLLTGERLALAQRWLAALQEAGQASEPVRELVDASLRRDRAFLRRVSDGIGRYVLANAERYPELSILLSLAALGECAATPAAQRALMSALAFSHLRMVLTGHADAVRDLAWSPDGTRIATASRDGTARIFDADTGHCERVLAGHAGMVEAIAWSPDSTNVATASRDRTVRLWDVASGRQVGVLTGARDILCTVAWSRDGRYVAAGSRDRVVRVWDAASGELAKELHGHSDNIYGIAWSADGRLATASHDRTVIVWDVGEGTPSLTLEGHTDFVEGVAWSPDGTRIATSSGDQTIRIWDSATGRQQLLIRGHTDPVWNVAWSPDGRRIASASTDRTARIFDASDAMPLAVLRGHDETVWGVTWSPDGSRIATGSADGTARIWDIQPRGAEAVLLGGLGQPMNQAAWSPDGRLVATVSDDGTLRFWDADTGDPAFPFGRAHDTRHEDRIYAVAWSPDGSRVVTGSWDGTARIWGTSGAVVLDHEGSAVEAVAWSPDGSRVATGGHDRTIRIWDVNTGSVVGVMTGHQDWVGGIAWSPSGRMISSVSDDRTCRIWDVGTGEQLTVLRGHENWVDGVSWSPDERHVVTGAADWTARVWEVATGGSVGVLRSHEGRVRTVAWSPDGSRIATGAEDRTVRIWDATTREEIVVAGVHQDKVTSVSWSSDGQFLLTSSFDGTARIWPVTPDFDRLQAIARNRVFRSLTEDERRRHLLPVKS